MILLTNFGQTFIISMLAVLIMAVLFGVVFFVHTLKNIKTTQQRVNEISNRLSVGQKVLLSSGILGEVEVIHEETVDNKTKSNSLLEVRKESIHEILG